LYKVRTAARRLMNKGNEKVLAEVEEQFKLYIEARYPKPNLRTRTRTASKGRSIDGRRPDEGVHNARSKIPGVLWSRSCHSY
jgi:hypothetical protein